MTNLAGRASEDEDARICPYCSEVISVKDNICGKCGRPPSEDRYTLLKEAIFALFRNMDYQKADGKDEKTEERVALAVEIISQMLCAVIDQVEERTQNPVFYSDCLRTASGMVVNNARFVVEEKLGRMH